MSHNHLHKDEHIDGGVDEIRGATNAQNGLATDSQITALEANTAHAAVVTGNPHSVTAAQAGAVSSANFSLHIGNASAHHAKTTTFTELTDQAVDAQDWIGELLHAENDVVGPRLHPDGAEF